MFYIGFFYFKKSAIRSFPHFWWPMWANRSGRSPNFFFFLPSGVFIGGPVCQLLRFYCIFHYSITKNERWERITQVTHQKWATMSELHRSLTKNERMSKLLFFWANRSFAHFVAKNERFAQKAMSEFPALHLSALNLNPAAN